MTSNPFEPLAPRSAPAPLSPAPRIAHGVALVAALAACIAWAVGWLYAMVSLPELDFARSGWLAGPLGLTGLAQEIALAGLTGLLTTRFWCEREAIGGHRRPLWLLAGVLIGGSLLPMFIASLLYGLWFLLEAGPLEFLQQSHGYSTHFLLVSTLIDLLTWLICGPLLIILLLRMSRAVLVRDPLARAVPRWEIALGLGLSVALLVALVFALLGLAVRKLDEPEAALSLWGCALVCGLVAVAATWRLLPLRGRRLRPLRLLGASLVCVLLWLLASALLSALLVVVTLYDDGLFVPASMLLGILSLVLLILLSRFCLRLIYRPRPG